MRGLHLVYGHALSSSKIDRFVPRDNLRIVPDLGVGKDGTQDGGEDRSVRGQHPVYGHAFSRSNIDRFVPLDQRGNLKIVRPPLELLISPDLTKA